MYRSTDRSLDRIEEKQLAKLKDILRDWNRFTRQANRYEARYNKDVGVFAYDHNTGREIAMKELKDMVVDMKRNMNQGTTYRPGL